MLCITLETENPFFNLAIEEVLLKNSREEFFLLSINSPSVILGKHQSAHREVNTKFVTENKIPVIRRISGGGTVFHDTGNLNFTFIRQSEQGKQVDFRKYTEPVIDFLSSLGVDARFEGKNDLKVDGLKVSGNAEHVHHNRVLHHGTLLFSSSLDLLKNSLRKDTSCYQTRAVASNPSSVKNLNDKLPEIIDIYNFRSAMMKYMILNLPDTVSYIPGKNEIAEAESLAESKYRSWEWNWAYGPEYQFINEFELEEKSVRCMLLVRDGLIRECSIEGLSVPVDINKKLIGCRHMVADLMSAFKNESFSIIGEEIYNFF